MSKAVNPTIYLLLFTFLSECTQYTDCPNGGQNYECIDELCTCALGHALDGDACVGVLPKNISETIFLRLDL